jgi:outer membrane biogenesis lipoprotein LolB
MRGIIVVALLLTACSTAPRSPAQQRLDACLKQADRNVIQSAQVEAGGRFSYRYFDGGGSGQEVERFVACMQGRAATYPTVR